MIFKNMSVQGGVTFVLDQLTAVEFDYGRTHQGFSGLHDICDANMLLPFSNDPDVEVTNRTYIDWCNEVTDAVTVALCGSPSLKSWAFCRLCCTPQGGTLVAKTSEEALKLVQVAYGYCSTSSVYCAETGEKLKANR